MFVNVEMCKTVLIAGESTDYEFSAAIFIELLKFFCEALTIIFIMHAYFYNAVHFYNAGNVSGSHFRFA